MLTLHDYRPSLNGWKVRVLLGLLGIEYRYREVALFQGESRTEDFLRLNPVGAVPVLELEDGRSIAESSAILVYLAQGTAWLPEERYLTARVVQWLSFEQYYIEPTIGSLRFWTLTGRLGVNEGRMIESRRENAVRALTSLERSLGDSAFLVGERLTIADIAVYAYTHRAQEAGFSLDAYAALGVWLGRVAAAIGPDYTVCAYTADALM